MTIGNEQFSLTKHPSNCFITQLNTGIKMQGQYAQCRKIDVKLWHGVVFVQKGRPVSFCFSNIMDANLYVGILEQHLPEIRGLLGGRWCFQQDNDPKHTSRIAKEFLQNNVPMVLDWPSNSPDLNPIENLWNIVKTNVERRKPGNFKELEQFMTEEWDNIPNSILSI